MKATYSRSTGICVFNSSDGMPEVVYAPESKRLNAALDRHALSLADDWEVTECPDIEEILQTTRDALYLERARALAQICLSFDDAELIKEVLQDIENDLATRVQPERLVARLLLAPLVDSVAMQELAEEALSLGFAATANSLKRVAELQPLLRRFVSYWLNLPDQFFASFSYGRREVWTSLVFSGSVPKLLEAESSQAFSNLFGPIIFAEPDVAKRKAIINIEKELAERLQIGDGFSSIEPPPYEETSEDADADHPATPHVAYLRALSQVDAIVKAVAEGRDARAKSILKELEEKQTEDASGIKYAVKSLCNVAQKCADLFRTDFERTALEKAIELDPSDLWTQIQFGDHLKRVGDYDNAVRVLNQAATYDPLRASALADVYAQRGEFERAIGMYKSIPNWESSPEVRNAIADNLRRLGSFDAAREAYDKLEAEGLGSSRSQVGKAEIAKRLGNLALAETIYRNTASQETDQRSLQIYKLALVGILKQQHKLDEAYRIVEALIDESPFLMPARLLRAAILGLMDQEDTGLESLPDSGKPRAYREWLQQYYRGLLLLKLGHFEDAKTHLVENLNSALLTGEERDIQRLAAAVAFLAKDEISEANLVLEQVVAVPDRYVEYLWKVLQLHLAVAEYDQERKDELLITLKSSVVEDEYLWQAVRELERGNMKQAIRFELKALLALAA